MLRRNTVFRRFTAGPWPWDQANALTSAAARHPAGSVVLGPPHVDNQRFQAAALAAERGGAGLAP